MSINLNHHVKLQLFLVILSGSAVALLLDKFTFGYRQVLFTLLFASGIGIVALGTKGVYFGLVFWVWMFILGYRTETIFEVRLHPLILFGIALWILLLVQIWVIRGQSIDWRAPTGLLIFMPFCGWGWLVGMVTGLKWDQMLPEAFNTIMLIPIFMLVDYLLRDHRRWPGLLWNIIGVGTLIAIFGVVEYLFPDVKKAFPHFIATETLINYKGFLRGAFAFWGSPAASFVCALALPLIWPLWQKAGKNWQRTALLPAAVIMIAGIYIGGYRSLWLTVGVMGVVMGVVMAYARWRLRGLVIAIAWLALIYIMAPSEGQERFNTLISAFKGDFQDTSTLERSLRISLAMEMALNHPLGLGWSAAGWVHSDLLQYAANLGVLASGVFIGWYLLTGWRLWQSVRRNPRDGIGLGLLGSFLVVGSLLLNQGVQVLPQFALPVWFIWALAHTWEIRSEQRAKVKNV